MIALRLFDNFYYIYTKHISLFICNLIFPLLFLGNCQASPNSKVYRSLRKIPQFHLISWCEYFVEKHSFRIASANSPETMRKLRLSKKLPHQEIRWNCGIFRSGCCDRSTESFLECIMYEKKKKIAMMELFSKTVSQTRPSFSR